MLGGSFRENMNYFKSIALKSVCSVIVLTILSSITAFASDYESKKAGYSKLQTLRIDAILPLTGPLKERGFRMQQGIELGIEALDTFYDLGGKLSVHDSESEHVKAGKLAQKITEMNEKPHLVIGASNPLSAKSIKLYLEAAKIPMMFPLLQDRKLLKGSRFVHTMSLETSKFVDAAWKFSKGHLRAKKIVLFLPLSQGGIDEVLSMVQSRVSKGTELKVITYKTEDEMDGYVKEALKFQPDVLWAPWADSHFVDLVKGVRAGGWSRPFLGFEDWPFSELSKSLKDAWIGNYVLRQFSLSLKTDASKRFLSLFKKKYPDSSPTEASALSYEATVLAGQALKKSAFRAEGLTFSKMLRRFGKFEGLAGSYSMRPDGAIIRPILVLETTRTGLRIVD